MVLAETIRRREQKRLYNIKNKDKIYDIDHIKPLCSFDFNDAEQIKKAFAPENHQWLTVKENLSKGGRF